MTKYLAALLLPCFLYAQSDSTYINGTELRLGMPKSDVLASLAERNNLIKSQGTLDDAWCVRAKDDHLKAACGDLVQFSQDKLTSVSREIGSSSGEDSAAMLSLFSTLEGLSKSGTTELGFRTLEFETDEHTRLRILSFAVGGKEYILTINRPVGSQRGKTSSVELQERLARRQDHQNNSERGVNLNVR
jgi:hypothetical protein